MIRASVLLIALLVTAPTIWAAFGEQTVSVTSALVHYLIAVPIVAVLLGLVRFAARASSTQASATTPDTQPDATAP